MPKSISAETVQKASHWHDPRLERMKPHALDWFRPLECAEEWDTYEVFQQKRRGEQHVHVGSVHAPDADMALVFAKEQFGRRQHCASLWVVRSRDVHALGYDKEDMFATTPEKTYREASGYRIRQKINEFKQAGPNP